MVGDPDRRHSRTACAWHRPPLWAWVVIAGLLALEKSINVYVFGNPSMWIVAAIAAGTIWRWPFVFVFAKPTFAPIALLGVRRRSWWVALGGARGGLSLLFLPVWLDWFTVVRNSDVSLLYNLPDAAADAGAARGVGDGSRSRPHGSVADRLPRSIAVQSGDRRSDEAGPDDGVRPRDGPGRTPFSVASSSPRSSSSSRSSRDAGDLWIDYTSTAYRRRWLADGSYYLPHQLTGVPYGLAPDGRTSCTRPTALFLFVPLVVRARRSSGGSCPSACHRHDGLAAGVPAPWAWVAMLVLLMWPRANAAFLFGNTDMWMAAGVAAGLIWGWPALILTLKPTLLPFALLGANRRAWWAGSVVLLVVGWR